MLFCSKSDVTVPTVASVGDTVAAASTADAGKVRLGGGYRLPMSTMDAGKVRLGGGYRLANKVT